MFRVCFSLKPGLIKYSGTPPYDHPVYKTTSLLRPYSFKPKVQNIDSFYYFEDPVNATTLLLRPGFYGPTVVALTGFHCIFSWCEWVYQEFSMILTQYGRHGKGFSTSFINQWDHQLIDTAFLDLAWEHSIWQRQSLFFVLFSVWFFLVVSQVLLPESCAFCRKDFKMFDSCRGCLHPPFPRPQPARPLKEVSKDNNSHLLFCFVYWRLFHHSSLAWEQYWEQYSCLKFELANQRSATC